MQDKSQISHVSPSSVETLFNRWAAPLTSWLQTCGLEKSGAEDIVQNIFLSLLRNPHSLPVNPASYFFISARRALGKRKSNVELSSAIMPFVPVSQTDDNCEVVAQALSGLAVEQREVVLLKFWHKMTFDEIAVALQVPRTTASSRYAAGMQKLQEKLSPYFG